MFLYVESKMSKMDHYNPRVDGVILGKLIALLEFLMSHLCSRDILVPTFQVLVQVTRSSTMPGTQYILSLWGCCGRTKMLWGDTEWGFEGNLGDHRMEEWE